MVAGGVATVTTATKEKGIGGSVSDTQISATIKTKLYQKDQEIHRRVGVNVQDGEVLLTGSLATRELIDEVEQIAWSVQGVKKVMNDMGISSDDSFGLTQGTTDSWITTQLKSSMLFDSSIKSINYSLKTVSGVVYIMGVAQDKSELNKVVQLARTTKGVQKVQSYVKIKDPKVTLASSSQDNNEAISEPVAEEEAAAEEIAES